MSSLKTMKKKSGGRKSVFDEVSILEIKPDADYYDIMAMISFDLAKQHVDASPKHRHPFDCTFDPSKRHQFRWIWQDGNHRSQVGMFTKSEDIEKFVKENKDELAKGGEVAETFIDVFVFAPNKINVSGLRKLINTIGDGVGVVLLTTREALGSA